MKTNEEILTPIITAKDSLEAICDTINLISENNGRLNNRDEREQLAVLREMQAIAQDYLDKYRDRNNLS